VSKVSDFLTVYRLYIRMRMKNVLVKKVSIVDIVIYTGRVSIYLEEEHDRGLGKWKLRIYDCQS